MMDMQFGTPGKRIVTGADIGKFPAEMQRIIKSVAAEMAKSMLPSLVESTLKELVKANEDSKKDSPVKTKKKPGRKPKIKTLENVELDSIPTV